MISERGARQYAALGALVALAVGVRWWLGTRVATPFMFIDELLHSELAESVATGGRFAARGEQMNVSYLYPLAIAPAWAFDSMAATYAAAKAINSALMTLGAVPFFFLARRLVSPGWALVATALVLLLPAFALTGTLMLENAFFPAFMLAALAITRALEDPTPARQLLALAAIGLATSARFQGLMLVVIMATAVAVHAYLASRAAGIPFGVHVRPFRVSAVAGGVVALAWIGLRALTGASLVPALGVYEGHAGASYTASDVLRWLLYNAGELTLSVGFVPVSALVVLFGIAHRRGSTVGTAERAFLAVTTATLAWLLMLAAFAASWEPYGIKERYSFYAAPLLLLALVVWVERGLPRPPVLRAVAILVPAGLVSALPLGLLFDSPSFAGNAFALFVFHDIAVRFAGGVDTARLVLGAGAIVAGVLFALVPRRAAVWLAPGLVAAFLVVSARAVAVDYEERARGVEALAGLDGGRTWLDRRIGGDASAAFLNTTGYLPEALRDDWWPTWVPVWQTEFWNRSMRGVITLALREPAPLRQSDGALDWGTGTIIGVRPPRYVFADERYRVAGTELGRSGRFRLYRASRPLRLESALEGVYADGWTDGTATYDVWGGEQAARLVEVTVSRAGIRAPRAKARVTVTAGTLTARGSEPATGEVLRTKELVLRGSAPGRVRIETPPPPFRVGVVVAGPTASPASLRDTSRADARRARVNFRRLVE